MRGANECRGRVVDLRNPGRRESAILLNKHRSIMLSKYRGYIVVLIAMVDYL